MKHQHRTTFAALALVALGFAGLGCRAPAAEHQSESAAHGAVDWGYSGATGPQHWGDLSPDNRLCKTGKQQSPVDLLSSAEPIRGSELNFAYQEIRLDLVDNGHTIQQTVAPGSYLEVNGKEYQLLQFHFHSKSEHTLAGQQQDLELHLVHQAADGEYAVVGVLFTEGSENAFLKATWDQLPMGAHKATTVWIDAVQALPEDRAYFAYDGSFTTPPGTEGVKWHVLRDVVECSAQQLATFRAIHSGNFRPVQKLYGRTVQLRE